MKHKPDADLLVLVGQVEAVPVLPVVAPDAVDVVAEEVLHAPLGRQVRVLARVLGRLRSQAGGNGVF